MADWNQDMLNVVHERDLLKLLGKINLKDDLDNDKLQCKFCKQVTHKESIGSLLKDGGRYQVVCNQGVCFTQLMQFLNDKRNALSGAGGGNQTPNYSLEG